MSATVAVLVGWLATTAQAGSIKTAGLTGGTESGATTPNVAAVALNPGALGAVEGFQGLVDLQASFIRLEVTTTRNGGIDPNTGERYLPATARAVVPNGVLGVAYKPIPELAIAFAAYDPFVGGGDYTSTEKGKVPPYTGHQRYHIIDTAILTFAFEPAVAVTPVKGVHVGAGVAYVKDFMQVLQASDPLGTEGINTDELDLAVPDNPYALDTYLSGSMSGHHWTWNAGFLIDRWRFLQVGVSYAHSARFVVAGDGSVDVPQDLSTVEGGVVVPANVSVEFPLPSIVRLSVNSEITEMVNVAAGVDYQLWNVCCGEEDGDIAIGLTNEQGNAIGPDDGVAIEIATEQYSPRRLWNAMDVHVLVGVRPIDKVEAYARLMYNQNAVPDYAVSPSNLDFQNVGVSLAGRYRVIAPLVLGLGYTKYFLFERTITDSAWDLRDGNTRFSPELPYKAGTNGTYGGLVDSIGLRIGVEM